MALNIDVNVQKALDGVAKLSTGFKGLSKSVSMLEADMASLNNQNKAFTGEMSAVKSTVVDLTSRVIALEKSLKKQVVATTAVTKANISAASSFSSVAAAANVSYKALLSTRAELNKLIASEKTKLAITKEMIANEGINAISIKKRFIELRSTTAQTDMLNAAMVRQAKLTAELTMLDNAAYQAILKKNAGLQATIQARNAESAQTTILNAAKKQEAALTAQLIALDNAEYQAILRKTAAIQASIAARTAEITATNGQTAAQTANINANTNARAAVRGLAGAMGGLWLSYNNILPVLATFAAALTAIKSIKISSEFAYTTQYIDALNTHAGNATVTLDEMREELIAISGTRHGVTDLAMGMKEFAKAGVDTSVSIGQMAEMSKFAAVAELELSKAIELVIGQANAFGVSYSDAANMIAASATSSATSIEQLATAMSYTTELGSVSKVSFEEVATAMAVLANAGIRSSKAGTSLKTSIVRMQTPTEKLKDMFKDLNIEWSAFTEDGQVTSIKEMFSSLEESIEGLTDQQKVEVLKELFGLRSMKGGANILAQISDSWDGIAEHVGNAAGEVTLLSKIHDDLMDTSKAKVELLGAEWENFLNSAMIEEFSKMVLDAARSVVAFAHVMANLPEIAANWTADAILQDIERIRSGLEAIGLVSAKPEIEVRSSTPGHIADQSAIKIAKELVAEAEKAANEYQRIPTIYETLGREAPAIIKKMQDASSLGDFSNKPLPFMDTFQALENINKYNKEADQEIIKSNEAAKKAQEERLHYAEYASERMVKDRWLQVANFNSANAKEIADSVAKAEEHRSIEREFTEARKDLNQEVLEESLKQSGKLYELEIAQADQYIQQLEKSTGQSLAASAALVERRNQLYDDAAASQKERVEQSIAAEDARVQAIEDSFEKERSAIDKHYEGLEQGYDKQLKKIQKYLTKEGELTVSMVEQNLEAELEALSERYKGNEKIEDLIAAYKAEKILEFKEKKIKERKDLAAISKEYFDDLKLKHENYYEAIEIMEYGWSEVVKTSQSELGDFFVDQFGGLEGAWGDLWDNMLRKFASVLTEMAATWAAEGVGEWMKGLGSSSSSSSSSSSGSSSSGGGWIGPAVSAVGEWVSSLWYADGGYVARNPRGGKINAGSGVKDDVFLGYTGNTANYGMGGEYIVNKKATAQFLPLLESINKKNYADGGVVGGGGSGGSILGRLVTGLSTTSSHLNATTDDINRYGQTMSNLTQEIIEANGPSQDLGSSISNTGASLSTTATSADSAAAATQGVTEANKEATTASTEMSDAAKVGAAAIDGLGVAANAVGKTVATAVGSMVGGLPGAVVAAVVYDKYVDPAIKALTEKVKEFAGVSAKADEQTQQTLDRTMTDVGRSISEFGKEAEEAFGYSMSVTQGIETAAANTLGDVDNTFDGIAQGIENTMSQTMDDVSRGIEGLTSMSDDFGQSAELGKASAGHLSTSAGHLTDAAGSLSNVANEASGSGGDGGSSSGGRDSSGTDSSESDPGADRYAKGGQIGGQFVVNKAATSSYAPFLDAINTFSDGGMIPAPTTSTTPDRRATQIADYSGSLMDAFLASISELKSYEDELNASRESAADTLKETIQLSENEELQDLLTGYVDEIDKSTLTDYQYAIRELQKEYEDAIEAATELGATEEHLDVIRQASALATQELIDKNQETIDDMLSGYYQVLDDHDFNQYQISWRDFLDTAEAAIVELGKLGAAEEEILAVRAATILQLHELEVARQEEITSMMDDYNAVLDSYNFTAYELEARDLLNTAEAAIVELEKLGAAEEDVMAVRSATILQLHEMELSRLAEIDSALSSYQELIDTKGLNDYEKSIRDVNLAQTETEKSLEDLGASWEDLQVVMEGVELQLEEIEKQRQDNISSALSSYQELIDTKGLSDYEQSIRDVTLAQTETEKSLEDLGASWKDIQVVMEGVAIQLEEIEAQRQADIDSALSSYQELWDTSSLSDYEKSMRDLNIQYQSSLDLLNSLGASEAELSVLRAAYYTQERDLLADSARSMIDSYLDGLLSEVDAANAKVQESEAAVNDARSLLNESITESFSASITEAGDAYQEQIDKLNEAISEASSNLSTLRGMIDRLVGTPAQIQGRFDTAQAALARRYKSGNFSGDLSDISAATDIDSSMFQSSSDMARTTAKTSIMLESLAGRASSQLTADEKQLAAVEKAREDTLAELEAQRDILLNVETSSALTIEELQAQLEQAQLAYEEDLIAAEAAEGFYKEQQLQLEAEYEAILDIGDQLSDEYKAILGINKSSSTLPQIQTTLSQLLTAQLRVEGLTRTVAKNSSSSTPLFGSYATGTEYVPRTGPYLLHQGEKVIPAGESEADTARLLSRLLEETRAGNVAIAKNTAAMAKYIKSWDGTGMPEVREVS